MNEPEMETLILRSKVFLRMEERIDELQKINAGLLEAANKALSALIAYQPPSGTKSFVSEAIDQLQAAIAQAEGRP